jgi:hypothetical protein
VKAYILQLDTAGCSSGGIKACSRKAIDRAFRPIFDQLEDTGGHLQTDFLIAEVSEGHTKAKRAQHEAENGGHHVDKLDLAACD